MRILLLPLAVAATFLPLDAAHAATLSRDFFQNGGNACTGALPTYEGALRKRPQAIANEGTTTAFVTCSLEANNANSETPKFFYAGFANTTAADATFNCVLVDGNAPQGAVLYPKSITVEAGVVSQEQDWQPPEPDTHFSHASLALSCALPPGIALNYILVTTNEDVEE